MACSEPLELFFLIAPVHIRQRRGEGRPRCGPLSWVWVARATLCSPLPQLLSVSVCRKEILHLEPAAFEAVRRKQVASGLLSSGVPPTKTA